MEGSESVIDNTQRRGRDIPEDEVEESDDEDSPNGEEIVCRHAHIQHLGNDDHNGDQEKERRLERKVFFEDFVDR